MPAGYLSTKAFLRILPGRYIEKIQVKYALILGIVGSIFPDLDMFYFYLIDNRQHLHHGYWTHIFFFWVCVFLPLFAIFTVLKKNNFSIYLSVFSINVFIHLFLNTIVGKIRWLYPFSSQDFVFFHVPARYGWWIWNFVFHWTFLFEIILITGALFLIIRNIRMKRQDS